MSQAKRNIKLLISYDGTGYSGWQRQHHDLTIQGEIESCLALMTRDRVILHGAGRTDAGVHADGMVANFITKADISCQDFLRGLNSMLPGAIRILAVEDVDNDFHARFSAVGKRYQYKIYTGIILPPQLRLYTVHVTSRLHLPAVRNCLKQLEGTHDFSSFENSGSRDKNKTSGRGAIRTIFQTALTEHSPFQLTLHFTGDGFLRNMVRNLVGTILEVGRGKITPEAFGEILAAKDRTKAAATAPAHGLFLHEVLYVDKQLNRT